MTETEEKMEETPEKTEGLSERETDETAPRDVSPTIDGTRARVEERAAETAVTETPAATVETRVERARVSEAPRRRVNRTALVAVALVAVAGLALLLWWLRREEGAGRVVSAPRAVTFGPADSAGAGGPASAPGEATLTVAADEAARAGIKVEAVGEQLAPGSAQQ